MTIRDFEEMKRQGEKISMVSCYDFWSARLVSGSGIDCLLVGDSVAMVVHGYPSTVSATLEMMALHTAAVRRGAADGFIVADLPFPSFRCGLETAMRAVDTLLKAGANAVKIEGIRGQEELVRHIVQSGVPVMGHLGLTPQSVNQLGGFRVQGRGAKQAERLQEEALRTQDAGCFSLVLECIPSELAAAVTSELEIPTIGIGAGPETDGQVLVLHDLLGLFKDLLPKFVRHFAPGQQIVLDALNQFDAEVKAGTYPSREESYQT